MAAHRAEHVQADLCQFLADIASLLPLLGLIALVTIAAISA